MQNEITVSLEDFYEQLELHDFNWQYEECKLSYEYGKQLQAELEHVSQQSDEHLIIYAEWLKYGTSSNPFKQKPVL